MPSARAPSTSSRSESPTMTAARGSTSSRSRTTRKMDGSGFTLPCTPEEIQASTSSEKCATNASRSRLVFETSPSAGRACAARRGRAACPRRARSWPSGAQPSVIARATSRRAGPRRPCRARCPREPHPDLLVVVELGVVLQVLDRRGACLSGRARGRGRGRGALRPRGSPRAPSSGPGFASVKSTSKRTASTRPPPSCSRPPLATCTRRAGGSRATAGCAGSAPCARGRARRR